MKIYSLFILLLCSCTRYHYYYGKARITVVNGRHHIQVMEKLKQLPDTTMEVTLITKMK